MKYVYASRHGKTEKLVQALGLDAVKLEDGTAAMSEDFIIFTYTDGKGIVPKIVEDYLKTCGDKLKGKGSKMMDRCPNCNHDLDKIPQ